MLTESAELISVKDNAQQRTIAREIKRWSELQPQHPAVVLFEHAPLSYGQLQHLIESWREDLRAAGLRRGARIVISFPHGPQAALATIAVACSCVAIPLNPQQTPDEIDRCIAALRPEAVIVPQGSDCTARRVAERWDMLIIEGIPTATGTIGLKAAAPGNRAVASLDEPDPDAPAFILQTSGTTSHPKLIPFSHRNMLAAAERMKAWFSLSPKDRCLVVTPIYYCHGLTLTLFTPLLTGGTALFPANVSKVDYSEWFQALGPTWYSAGPTLHRMIFDQVKSTTNLNAAHSLRFASSGGALLSQELRVGLQDSLGIPVLDHYGASEAGQISANQPGPGLSRTGTVGVPWPGTVIVVDDKGHRLLAGEQGEIRVRGPTVISGYLDAPELNRESFVDGWLRTGDLGSFDEEGFLTLRGRLKDVINRGGEKISPLEIDEALMRHPAVNEAAAFALPHSRLGEDIAAAVTLHPARTASQQELRTFLGDKLSPFKIPRRIFIVDQLPKGVSGKILRRRLSELYATAEASHQTDQAMPDSRELSRQLTEIWQRLLNYAPVLVDDDFFEKGGDSLLATEMLLQIERLTGLTLTSSVLFEATTIRKLADKLATVDALSTGALVKVSPNGTEAPLILFHGDSSGGSYVAKLAKLLGPNQPILVVSPHGTAQDPVPRSLEAMAADRLQAIVEAQPHGPYRLCGFCLSGLVAFEAARLLLAAGQKVDMVILIDPPTLNARRSVRAALSILNHFRPSAGSWAERVIAKAWYYVTKIEKFSVLSTAQRWQWAKQKLRPLFRSGNGGVKANVGTSNHGATRQRTPFGRMDLGDYHRQYSIAMLHYLPEPLPVRVIFFSAEHDGEAWRQISPDLEVIKLHGDHLSIVMDPTALAGHLRILLQTQVAPRSMIGPQTHPATPPSRSWPDSAADRRRCP
jgi:acyl-CoA synthetase (AMP-forming)/AMP-acid ligase II/thioesterase domain-containing protein